ncbi:ABC transporter substrate binding protein [Moraxella catarrhalis 103P14B1]|nr:ABC transporter substrate binding protein [Moraxella catarrhalis 103P14B1]
MTLARNKFAQVMPKFAAIAIAALAVGCSQPTQTISQAPADTSNTPTEKLPKPLRLPPSLSIRHWMIFAWAWWMVWQA